jgi:hypothetical protein
MAIPSFVEADFQAPKITTVAGMIPEVRPSPIVNGGWQKSRQVVDGERVGINTEFFEDISFTTAALLRDWKPHTPEMPLRVPLQTQGGPPFFLIDVAGEKRKSEYLLFLFQGTLVAVGRLVAEAKYLDAYDLYHYWHVVLLGKRSNQADPPGKERYTYDFWDAHLMCAGKEPERKQVILDIPGSNGLRAPKQRNVYNNNIIALLLNMCIMGDIVEFLKKRYAVTFAHKSRAHLNAKLNGGYKYVTAYDTTNWDTTLHIQTILAVIEGFVRAGLSHKAARAIAHFFSPGMMAFGTAKGKHDSWMIWNPGKTLTVDCSLLSGVWGHTEISNMVHATAAALQIAKRRGIQPRTPEYADFVRNLCMGTDGRDELGLQTDDIMHLSMDGPYVPDQKILTEGLEVPTKFLGFNVRYEDGVYHATNDPGGYLLNLILLDDDRNSELAGDIDVVRDEVYRSSGTPYMDDLKVIFDDTLKSVYGVGISGAFGHPTGALETGITAAEKILRYNPDAIHYLATDDKDWNALYTPDAYMTIPTDVVTNVREVFDL